MDHFLKKACLCFAAGCAGGLANSLVLWLAGALGINSALGVSLSPACTPAWLYPRIVWGGWWGFLFLLPLFKDVPVARGLVWSLGPTAAELFIFFPLVVRKGVCGVELGVLTPLLVAIFNAVWGIKAAAVLAIVDPDPLKST